MHGLVKWPCIITTMFICEAEIFKFIDENLDTVFGPLDCVHMECIHAIFDSRYSCFLRMNNMIVFFAVDRSMNNAGIKSNMLHNIYLAIIRPFKWCSRTKHPNGRPGAQAFWKFCANLNSTVFPV